MATCTKNTTESAQAMRDAALKLAREGLEIIAGKRRSFQSTYSWVGNGS